MLPATIYRGCASSGEHEIFRRLKNDPATTNWIVLHSLDVANHLKQVSGEVDFVILIPGKGVLFLEVKACSSLLRTEEGWYYGKNPQPDQRGPFKQASASMFSLRNQVLSINPQLSRIIFWPAVIFPYIEFKTKSVEWHPWQVIDRSLFASQPLSKSIESILDHAKDYLKKEKGFHWLDSGEQEPDQTQYQEIANILRPNFEFVESSKSKASRLTEELKYYTEEQFSALDAMERNHRVAYAGPAGTGKTLLALEAARRGSAENRRVLLLCFNRLLGKWLEEQSKEFSANVVTKTLHRHMLDVSGLEPEGEENNSTFWISKLPQAAIERLLEDTSGQYIFDELIIDEAQDILRENYLDFLDLSLKGGLSSGTWKLFGDFEKQAIYGSAPLTLEQVLEERASNAHQYSLRINCRNTPRVAEAARLLGSLEPSYRKVLRPDNGLEPQIHFYTNASEQQQLLLKSLDDLLASGYPAGDIVILSTKADSMAAAALVDEPRWKGRLKPYTTTLTGYARYCSIHAFKGLEAPVIIVTDVERISDPNSVALFYIAVTRSVERLVLLVNEVVRKDIVRILS